MTIKEFLQNRLQDNSQKHGKWIKDKYHMVHCSLCGQMPLMGLVSTPYCPWCGAMMESDLKPNDQKVEWKNSPSGCLRECSGCHKPASPETPFCPHCGAQTDYWDTFDSQNKTETVDENESKNNNGKEKLNQVECCANCGKEIDLVNDGYYTCQDNFLQLKYFEDPAGRDNIFCSKECACKALMIDFIYADKDEVRPEKTDEDFLNEP